MIVLALMTDDAEELNHHPFAYARVHGAPLAFKVLDALEPRADEDVLLVLHTLPGLGDQIRQRYARLFKNVHAYATTPNQSLIEGIKQALRVHDVPLAKHAVLLPSFHLFTYDVLSACRSLKHNAIGIRHDKELTFKIKAKEQYRENKHKHVFYNLRNLKQLMSTTKRVSNNDIHEIILNQRTVVYALQTPYVIPLTNERELYAYSIQSVPQDPLRFCFDLDDTLLFAGDGHANQRMVQYMRYLKRQKHTVIVSTWRPASTRAETIEALRTHKVPYDELHFDQPFADVRVGASCVNVYDSISKMIGHPAWREKKRI